MGAVGETAAVPFHGAIHSQSSDGHVQMQHTAWKDSNGRSCTADDCDNSGGARPVEDSLRIFMVTTAILFSTSLHVRRPSTHKSRETSLKRIDR